MLIRPLSSVFALEILLCSYACGSSCHGLARLPFARAATAVAAIVPRGAFTLPGVPPIEDLPSFCRVTATLKPSSTSKIKVEVWMPVSGWNGKYEGTGNGGYAGQIAFGELAAALRRGYAVANTDMGTASEVVPNGDGLVGQPERWLDWGSRSTHLMTVFARSVVNAYYRRAPRHSYFVGCSTGGEQALMEAQRFPDDYDGIVAGAPANNRTRLHMAILWNFEALTREAGAEAFAERLPRVAQAVGERCAVSKVRTSDAFLSDPLACHVDARSLVCKDGSPCLDSEQAARAQSIYAGPIDPVTKASIYPGLPPGSESGWSELLSPSDRPPYDSLFLWVFGLNWDSRRFDFHHDVEAVDARLGTTLNATNPDLAAFKAHGHKLIVFHGWADWLVSPLESINYYEEVLKADSRVAASHPQTKEHATAEYYRLFMVPGMAHCGGGPGLNAVDTLPSLERWVEQGLAPEQIIARRNMSGGTEMTRPVCPYPRSVSYKGTGDPNDAHNFSCSAATSRSATSGREDK